MGICTSSRLLLSCSVSYTFIRAFLFFTYLFFNFLHEQDTSRFENLSTENIVYKTKNTRETHRSLILDAVRARPRGREAKGLRTTSDVWEAKIVPFLNLLINLMENSAFSICQFLYYIFPSYPRVHVCRGLANLKTVLKKKKSNLDLALQWEQPRVSCPVYVDSLIYYHYYFCLFQFPILSV